MCVTETEKVPKIGTPDGLCAGGKRQIALPCLLVEGHVLAFPLQIAPQFEIEIGFYILLALAQCRLFSSPIGSREDYVLVHQNVESITRPNLDRRLNIEIL